MEPNRSHPINPLLSLTKPLRPQSSQFPGRHGGKVEYKYYELTEKEVYHPFYHPFYKERVYHPSYRWNRRRRTQEEEEKKKKKGFFIA
jgi:hypothetical protein